MRLIRLFFVALAGGGAFAQTPSDLSIAAASKQRVELRWRGSAANYQVQRRVVGGAFSNIATVTGNSTSDVIVDPHATYQYQISVPGSATTNTVTVGPPPAGFSVAAMAPGAAGSDAAANYGFSPSVVLDANGDPAIAFIYNDPNLDGNDVDAELRFRSWNRAQYRWNNDVRVATVGIRANRFRPSVSLAYDPLTNTFAVASETIMDSIQMFTSADGGAVWSHKVTLRTDSPAWGPSLALSGGNGYLAYNLDGEGIRYLSGKFAAEVSSWTVKIAPETPDTLIAVPGIAPSLALDSSGNPGIAYWVAQAGNRQPVLMYWRPAQSALPVRVMDNQNQPSEQLAVKLQFSGTQPRVGVDVQRRDAPLGIGLRFAFSQDGGTTWQSPIVLPPDGGTATSFPFDLAIDSQGRAAIAFGQTGGSGSATCGNPKLALSNDLIAWRTCSAADRASTADFSSSPAAISAIYGANDKLFLIWRETNANATGTGLLLWREPPVGHVPGPSLDAGSAVNGATYVTGMVPGSWAQVKGSNLSGVTRVWNEADFVNGANLPTALSGVQVRVNTLPAAIYYVSPTQISFQVPAGVTGTANVQVIRDGALSNTVIGAAVESAPGLFAYAAGSKTYPSAVFANSSVVVGDPSISGGTVRKAAPGDRIQLYATGLAPSPAGVVIGSVAGLSGVTATIGSSEATVEFAGLVAVGQYQINIVVPPLADGEYPVIIRYNGQSSQAGVMVPIGR